MRIFMTGATGVIGREAVPRLVGRGHEVTAVGRRDDARVWLDSVGARPVDVDLFDAEAVKAAVAGAEAVAHFATAIPALADRGTPAAWATNDRLRREATHHLVEAAREAGVGRFVQESITFVYADGGDHWIDEDSEVAPVSFQLVSALDGEEEVRRFTTGGGEGVVLRMSRLYGPGRASGEFVAALRARRAPVVGRGENFVSSLHTVDAATAVVASLSVPPGTYNVSDDRPMRAGEMSDRLAEQVGAKRPRRLPTVVARLAAGGSARIMPSHRVSNARFREATGWAPIYESVLDGWPDAVAPGRR